MAKTLDERKNQLANLRKEKLQSTDPAKRLAWAKTSRDTQIAKLDRTRQEKKGFQEKMDELQAKVQGLEQRETAQCNKMANIRDEILRLEAECKEQDAKKFGDMDGKNDGDDSDFEGDGDSETNGEDSQATGKPRQERGSDQGPNRRAKRQCKGQVASSP